jgi:hypothetical protein
LISVGVLAAVCERALEVVQPETDRRSPRQHRLVAPAVVFNVTAVSLGQEALPSAVFRTVCERLYRLGGGAG